MTDTELNEAVARKLGCSGERNSWTMNFSTSIEAAWEIFEKTTSWFLGKHFEGGYLCRLGTQSGFYEAEADTAPRAICEAFLKLNFSPDESLGTKRLKA